MGYAPKLPVDPIKLANPIARKKWAEEKNMKVFSFIHEKDDYKILDIFVEEPIAFSDAYKRRQVIKADSVKISCKSI